MKLTILRFQSTRPLGGATAILSNFVQDHPVSIHAPPGGRDRLDPKTSGPGPGFNPRAPWGARHQLAPRRNP